MVVPFFSKRSNVFDEAFRTGVRPGEKNQLGPNPVPITDPKDFANVFVQKKFNPGSKDFYPSGIFSAETAGLSQDKINSAASTDFANFRDPNDNKFANDFLMKYSGPGGAIERGLVEQDRAVTKEGLAKMVTQPATFGFNFKDPNTASQFPGQGGIKI
jgi:hypothetical protein